jgi:Polyketide cyclase / dehydrase and lipid transport
MPPQGNPRAQAGASLEFAASPPVLWATFADVAKWPRWCKVVESAQWTAGPEWTLGAQLELAMDLPFPVRHWRGAAVITEIQPAASIAWETGYPLEVIVIHSCQFKPSELGTLLTIREAYYGNAVWLYRLERFPGQMSKAFEAALQSLKVYLEVGA